MKLKKRSLYSLLSIFFLMSFFISSCDDSFDPFNEDQGFYSIFGDLNLHKDINFIRVKNLNITLDADTTQQLNATVTLKNLTNGTSEVLKDSTINFDGVITHNFYTKATIKEASEYEIVVDGPEGNSVSMKRTSPYDSDISIDTGNADDGCNAQITITIEPVMQISTLFADVSFLAPGNKTPKRTYQYKPDIEFTDINEQGAGKKTLRFTPEEAILAQNYLARISEGRNPCSVLLKDTFSLNMRHFGSDYYTTVSDSIKIPGGEGRFIAYYDSTLKFIIPAVSSFVNN